MKITTAVFFTSLIFSNSVIAAERPKLNAPTEIPCDQFLILLEVPYVEAQEKDNLYKIVGGKLDGECKAPIKTSSTTKVPDKVEIIGIDEKGNKFACIASHKIEEPGPNAHILSLLKNMPDEKAVMLHEIDVPRPVNTFGSGYISVLAQYYIANKEPFNRLTQLIPVTFYKKI